MKHKPIKKLLLLQDKVTYSYICVIYKYNTFNILCIELKIERKMSLIKSQELDFSRKQLHHLARSSNSHQPFHPVYMITTCISIKLCFFRRGRYGDNGKD